jgi:hypothetical protein
LSRLRTNVGQLLLSAVFSIYTWLVVFPWFLLLLVTYTYLRFF